MTFPWWAPNFTQPGLTQPKRTAVQWAPLVLFPFRRQPRENTQCALDPVGYPHGQDCAGQRPHLWARPGPTRVDAAWRWRGGWRKPPEAHSLRVEMLGLGLGAGGRASGRPWLSRLPPGGHGQGQRPPPLQGGQRPPGARAVPGPREARLRQPELAADHSVQVRTAVPPLLHERPPPQHLPACIQHCRSCWRLCPRVLCNIALYTIGLTSITSHIHNWMDVFFLPALN